MQRQSSDDDAALHARVDVVEDVAVVVPGTGVARLNLRHKRRRRHHAGRVDACA